jgi:hypothetical protein
MSTDLSTLRSISRRQREMPRLFAISLFDFPIAGMISLKSSAGCGVRPDSGIGFDATMTRVSPGLSRCFLIRDDLLEADRVQDSFDWQPAASQRVADVRLTSPYLSSPAALAARFVYFVSYQFNHLT